MRCECDADDDNFVDPSDYIARINKCINIVRSACFEVANVGVDDKVFIKIVKDIRYQLLKVIMDITPRIEKPLTMKCNDDIEREMFCIAYEETKDKEKTNNIRGEWRIQQKRMAELQEEIFKMNRQLSLYSDYSSSQGSVFTNILAKTLTQDGVIANLMQEQEFLDFMNIIEGCLQSFARKHLFKLPLNDDPTYKYALALCTATVNITELPKGRVYLLRHRKSRSLLRTMIRLIPLIECPTGESIKLACLECLNNITKSKKGPCFLHGAPAIETVFNNCLNHVHSADIIRKCLDFLDNITSYVDAKCEAFYDRIRRSVCPVKFKGYMESSDREMTNSCHKIVRNLEKAKKYFEQLKKQREAERKAKEQKEKEMAEKQKRKTKVTPTAPKRKRSSGKSQAKKMAPRKSDSSCRSQDSEKKTGKKKTPRKSTSRSSTESGKSTTKRKRDPKRSASDSSKDLKKRKKKERKPLTSSSSVSSDKSYRGVLYQPSESSAKSSFSSFSSSTKTMSPSSSTCAHGPLPKRNIKRNLEKQNSEIRFKLKVSVSNCSNNRSNNRSKPTKSSICKMSNDTKKAASKTVCIYAPKTKACTEKQIEKSKPSSVRYTCSLRRTLSKMQKDELRFKCSMKVPDWLTQPAEEPKKARSESSCTCSPESSSRLAKEKPKAKSVTMLNGASSLTIAISKLPDEQPKETNSKKSCACPLQWEDLVLEKKKPKKCSKPRKSVSETICKCLPKTPATQKKERPKTSVSKIRSTCRFSKSDLKTSKKSVSVKLSQSKIQDEKSATESSCVCPPQETDSKLEPDTPKNSTSKTTCIANVKVPASKRQGDKPSRVRSTCKVSKVGEKKLEETASKKTCPPKRPISKQQQAKPDASNSGSCACPSKNEKPKPKMKGKEEPKKQESANKCGRRLSTADNSSKSPKKEEPKKQDSKTKRLYCRPPTTSSSRPSKKEEPKKQDSATSKNPCVCCPTTTPNGSKSKSLIDIRATEKPPNKQFVPACTETKSKSSTNIQLKHGDSASMYTCLSILSAVCKCHSSEAKEEVNQQDDDDSEEDLQDACYCQEEEEGREDPNERALVPVGSSKIEPARTRSRIPMKVWTASNLASTVSGARQRVTTRYKIPEFQKKITDELNKK